MIIMFMLHQDQMILSPENVNYIKYDVLNDELDTTSIPESIDGFVYLPGSINLRPFKSLSIESFKEDLEINLMDY